MAFLSHSFWRTWKPSTQPLIMSEHLRHPHKIHSWPLTGLASKRLTWKIIPRRYISYLSKVALETLIHRFYRNLGSSRWIPMVEFLSLSIAPGTISAYLSHLLFCYILCSTTIKATYSGLMRRRTLTITAKCFNGFFLQYVLLYIKFREKFYLTTFSLAWWYSTYARARLVRTVRLWVSEPRTSWLAYVFRNMIPEDIPYAKKSARIPRLNQYLHL